MPEQSGIITATKLTMVEALRAVFDAEFELEPDSKPFPRRIDIEYVEEAEDWPFILVQTRLQNLAWTGLNPDEYFIDDTGTARRFRHGIFDGFLDLSIYALTSEERDRMSDTLIMLFLAGRLRPVTKDFFDRLATGELIGLTGMEGSIEPLGDAVSQGTPWANELMTYEASIRVGVVGEFYMDQYTSELLRLSEITAHESLEGITDPDTGLDIADEDGNVLLPSEPLYGEGDGRGVWQEI